MPILSYILTALGGYLLGSVPAGYLVAKARGIDIRTSGSGNIGATNAMRVLGKPAGIFVMLVDALKGFAACYWLAPFVFNVFAPDHIVEPLELKMRFSIIAGICAVLGHNYTFWLHFKGGKGIATTAGVYLALALWPVFIAVGIFILFIAVTRYVSVGSIMAAITLPAAVWAMMPGNVFLGIVTTALGALAVYKHRSNIRRLMAGTENRIGQKPKETI